MTMQMYIDLEIKYKEIRIRQNASFLIVLINQNGVTPKLVDR